MQFLEEYWVYKSLALCPTMEDCDFGHIIIAENMMYLFPKQINDINLKSIC